MNEAYFKFLKYFNIIDISVLICLYLRNSLFFVSDTNNYLGFSSEPKFYAFLILIFLLIIINNIYHIKKVGIKRKISFIFWISSIKYISFLIIVDMFYNFSKIQSLENIIAFIIWLSVGYCFLNTHAYILEDKRNISDY